MSNPVWVRNLCLTICSLGLFLSLEQDYAAENPLPTIKVEVKASGADGLGEQITSYANRELQTIKDVQTTDKLPEVTLIIAAVETHVGGHPSGYALAITETRHFDISILKEAFDKKLSQPAYLTLVDDYMRGAVWNQLVKVTPLDHLEQTCKETVAELDGGCLEALRRSRAFTASETTPAK